MASISKPKRKKPKNNGNSYERERRKIYQSERWKRLREIKITNSPLCESCLEEGKTVEAEDVHHIVSFMSTEDKDTRNYLAYNYDNLMSLCKQCHQLIHNRIKQ